MIGVGDLVTWFIKEDLEWADPPIGVVTEISERDTTPHRWCRVTFLIGYRANQTFEIREQQIRRIENE
jgi:hypothetical protein